MVNVAKSMESDGVKRAAKMGKDRSDKLGLAESSLGQAKAAKKEAKMVARKEKKLMARAIRNKKTAAEFGNHKFHKCKNTEEKLDKNMY